MNAVIGDILPLALAVAISPIPIIATILMLMSPKPRPLGLSFLGGWVVGIGVAVVAFTLLGGILLEPETGDSRPVMGTIQLIVGALLLLMAVKQWRGRPGPGEDAELPTWMAAIDTMKPGAALGLALLLSAVNPKNLLLAVAAGASIGRAQLGTGPAAIVIAVFVVIAAVTVAAPVVLYLVAPGKAADVLDEVRAWLVANTAAIMAVLLLVIGTQLLGKGLGSF